MLNVIEHLGRFKPLMILDTENWWSYLEANPVKLCMYVPSYLGIFHRAYSLKKVSVMYRDLYKDLQSWLYEGGAGDNTSSDPYRNG